jgi:TonB family protein
MSPEQASGGDIDHRSDLFSLGLVLHEMLTGEQVFTGSTETAILEQVRDPKVTAPSAINGDISDEIDRIVLKALEPDPDMRYQSAGDLQGDLEDAVRAAGWMPDAVALATFVEDPTVAPEIVVTVPEEPESVELLPPEPVEPVEPPPPVEPVVPPEPAEPVEPPEPLEEDEVEELGAIPFEEAAEPLEPFIEEPTEERKKPLLLYLGIAVLAVMVGVMVVILRGGGGEIPVTSTPVPLIEVPRLPAPTETPTPAPEQVVARPVVPTRTPTPGLPTETPTETVTPTPEVTDTPTPVPPTATPEPPTPTPTPRPPTPTFTPSVREGDLVSAGPDVKMPVAVHQVTPAFPPVAQRLRVSGSVEAEVLVGPDGTVEDIRIVSVSRTGVGFERATEDAIRQWRYKPATKNGVKVRTWVTVRVPFRYR